MSSTRVAIIWRYWSGSTVRHAFRGHGVVNRWDQAVCGKRTPKKPGPPSPYRHKAWLPQLSSASPLGERQWARLDRLKHCKDCVAVVGADE